MNFKLSIDTVVYGVIFSYSLPFAFSVRLCAVSLFLSSLPLRPKVPFSSEISHP